MSKQKHHRCQSTLTETLLIILSLKLRIYLSDFGSEIGVRMLKSGQELLILDFSIRVIQIHSDKNAPSEFFIIFFLYRNLS